jgi:hypothetical protein
MAETYYSIGLNIGSSNGPQGSVSMSLSKTLPVEMSPESAAMVLRRMEEMRNNIEKDLLGTKDSKEGWPAAARK